MNDYVKATLYKDKKHLFGQMFVLFCADKYVYYHNDIDSQRSLELGVKLYPRSG